MELAWEARDGQGGMVVAPRLPVEAETGSREGFNGLSDDAAERLATEAAAGRCGRERRAAVGRIASARGNFLLPPSSVLAAE